MKKYKSVKECYAQPSGRKVDIENGILRYLASLGTSDSYYIDSYNCNFFVAGYKIPRAQAEKIAQGRAKNYHLCKLLREFPNDEFVGVRETYANCYYYRWNEV